VIAVNPAARARAARPSAAACVATAPTCTRYAGLAAGGGGVAGAAGVAGVAGAESLGGGRVLSAWAAAVSAAVSAGMLQR